MNKYFWLIALGAAFSLSAEETAVVNRARVNVRGGPSFASEVIAQLQKGDTVTFIEEVPVEKPKPGEPAKWAAIKLPQNTAVWVFTDFLNDHTVKVPRLNLRAGPGENFSVVGRLQRGDTVKEMRVVEGWMQIEAPESTRAFVDANYLTRTNTPPPEPVKVFEPKIETPPVIVAAKPEETKPQTPPPAETKAVEQPKVVEAPKVIEQPKVETPKPVETKPAETKPAETKVVENKPVESKPVTTPVEKAPEPEPRVLPKVAEAPPVQTETVVVKRVVRREGVVKPTVFNIQAPTYFQLVAANGKVINYLRADTAGIKLKDYKGLRVIVTGEELIEPRFPERPMLEVETIEVAP